MTRKLLSLVLALMIVICGLPIVAMAEVSTPAALGAPLHFGVGHYANDAMYFTMSLPEDLRTYIEKQAADDPENKQNFSLHFQIDYKIGSGSWHHTPVWDSPKTVPDGLDDLYLTFHNGKKYNSSERWSMTGIFPEVEALKPLQEKGGTILEVTLLPSGRVLLSLLTAAAHTLSRPGRRSTPFLPMQRPIATSS